VRLAAGVAASLLVTCVGARAQSAPSPVPAASPPPIAGYVIHGHLEMTVGGQARAKRTVQVVTERRGTLTRITLDSADRAPIGPGLPLVIVIDGATHTTTFWSPLMRRYHVQHAGESAFPLPPGFAAKSPLSLFETFAFSMSLTGRSLVGTTPTDDFAFSWNAQLKAMPFNLAVKGTVQLADATPMTLMGMHLTVQPTAVGAPPATSFAIDFDYLTDDVSPVVPPASDFVVPAGYVSTDTLGNVLSPMVPLGPAAPSTVRPVPSPTPAGGN
jgi:hypothetical protein